MFREVYKQVNDEIKGDRAILDKAFLRAAQPEKKKNIILRYSAVATAAVAVFILGAVFVNGNLFTDKLKNTNEEEKIVENKENNAEDINELDDSMPAYEGGAYVMGKQSKNEEEITAFSYIGEAAPYLASGKGAVTEGFENVDECVVENAEEAIQRALEECTVEYDTVDVYYDKAEDMWKVAFSMEDTLGGNQIVYMNEKGITTLIVYGK